MGVSGRGCLCCIMWDGTGSKTPQSEKRENFMRHRNEINVRILYVREAPNLQSPDAINAATFRHSQSLIISHSQSQRTDTLIFYGYSLIGFCDTKI